jgi:hypothetical protein
LDSLKGNTTFKKGKLHHRLKLTAVNFSCSILKRQKYNGLKTCFNNKPQRAKEDTLTAGRLKTYLRDW